MLSQNVTNRIRVAVETPQHSGLGAPLDYRSERLLAPGTLVRVPLGRRQVPGVVWPGASEGELPADLKAVDEALGSLPPMTPAWCRLVEFAAAYYQRGTGEVALSVLPPELRKLDDAQIANRIAKLKKRLGDGEASAPQVTPPPLSAEQAQALRQLFEDAAPAPAPH